MSSEHVVYALGLDVCPQCRKRLLYSRQGRNGLHESCLGCGYIFRDGNTRYGTGVVAIFTCHGGSVESRRPTAADISRFDALQASEELSLDESYLTIVGGDDNLVVVRGQLP